LDLLLAQERPAFLCAHYYTGITQKRQAYGLVDPYKYITCFLKTIPNLYVYIFYFTEKARFLSKTIPKKDTLSVNTPVPQDGGAAN
jgi:hypothetical protein